MKKIAIIIFILANLNLFSQTTYVPDDNFEQALIDDGYDDILDDYVLTANISGITLLIVYNNNISDLTGIEGFTALTFLSCSDNQLTSLDVSANTALTYLTCWGNQLTNLDLSANTALLDLNCSVNQLTNLNVSANTALTDLNCSTNQLTSLDLSANTALNDLNCLSNQLTSLNLSANTALNYLICLFNQLTSLDLSTNTALTHFNCRENQLTSLDVRNGNNANFSYFEATNNPNLTCIFVDDATWSAANWSFIDASSNFVETEAECDAILTYVPDDNFEQALINLGYDDVLDDYVITANISGIIVLNVENKSISDLTGIEGFTSLTHLFCHENQLTSLDMSANTNLYYLTCHENQLTSLNVSTNTTLEYLYCYENQLTSLDVSALTDLEALHFEENQLTSMDVSANTSLIWLKCASNQLTSLDIRSGNNTNLWYFDATNNPNLRCIFVDDATWSTTNWIFIDASSNFVETEAECDALDVKDISNNGLTIYPNPTKDIFSINTNNKIESIKVYDVFGKIILEKTVVNQKETIDLSSYNNGIYIIRVQADKNIITSKIVKD